MLENIKKATFRLLIVLSHFYAAELSGMFEVSQNVRQLLHLAYQFIGCYAHFAEAKPFLTKVFEACANQIDGIINAKEPVVRAVELLCINRRILRIMFLEIHL